MSFVGGVIIAIYSNLEFEHLEGDEFEEHVGIDR